jgi:hypothetical protein
VSAPAVRCLIGLAILVPIAGPLLGCANQSALRAPEAAGWRVAWVAKILKGRDLEKSQASACVTSLAPELIASGRFVIVRYSTGARFRPALTFPIPESLELKVGDQVHINILDCEEPISKTAE